MRGVQGLAAGKIRRATRTPNGSAVAIRRQEQVRGVQGFPWREDPPGDPDARLGLQQPLDGSGRVKNDGRPAAQRDPVAAQGTMRGAAVGRRQDVPIDSRCSASPARTSTGWYGSGACEDIMGSF